MTHGVTPSDEDSLGDDERGQEIPSGKPKPKPKPKPKTQKKITDVSEPAEKREGKKSEPEGSEKEKSQTQLSK